MATVRVFYYSGYVRAAEGIMLLQQPYLGRDMVEFDAIEAVDTNGNGAPSGTCLARIEVQPGKAVYCEVVPPQGSREADSGSPMIEGKETVAFGPGWKLSFLEVDRIT